MLDTASDAAIALAAAGIGLTLGTNLFVGPMPEAIDDPRSTADVPDVCVALLQTGGEAPLPIMGWGKRAVFKVVVQVHVRGAREDFRAGQTLAGSIRDALNQTSPTGYLSLMVRESAPFYGGTDGAGRHQWSLNLVGQYLETPT